jgi:hypothetical protein
MTKLKWKDRRDSFDRRDGFSRWTARASRVVGGEYRIEGPIFSDGSNTPKYPIFHLGPRPGGRLFGRYLKPCGATLSEAMTLAQADNDELRAQAT